MIRIILAALLVSAAAHAAPPQNTPEFERFYDICQDHRDWTECGPLIAAWWTVPRDLSANPEATAKCGKQCWGVKQYPRNRRPGDPAQQRQELKDFMAGEGIH